MGTLVIPEVAAEVVASLFRLCEWGGEAYSTVLSSSIRLVSQIVSREAAAVFETFMRNGWRGFITQQTLQSWFNLAAEDANIAAPVIRMIAAFGGRSYFAGFEVRLKH